jgi:hypothetical protein
MQTSRDVVFDESRPFYPRPTTDASSASLVNPLYFLLFPDAPPASLPIPCLTLPSSVSSSESPLVVSDYTVKPLVTQFYSRRGARLSDAPPSSYELSSDMPSSSFFEDVPSSPVEPSSPIDSSLEHLVRRSHRLRRPQSLLFLSQLLIVRLFFIRNGNTRWPRTLPLLCRLARGILCLVPHVFVQSLVSGSIRLRLALMVLLSAIRLVLLLVVFRRSKVVIMMRLLLPLLI